MPPKKNTTPSKAKPAAAAPAHGSYIDMVKDAIINVSLSHAHCLAHDFATACDANSGAKHNRAQEPSFSK
jgi:hypothetical protein